MQQALEAAGICTVPKQHAREEEENKVQGGRLCWEASGQEGAYQVLLNGPRTARAVSWSHSHSPHQV